MTLEQSILNSLVALGMWAAVFLAVSGFGLAFMGWLHNREKGN